MSVQPFFVTGGTIRPDSPCYVERACDKELLEALCRGEYCYVLDSRQKGKSSLMARTIETLKLKGYACSKLDLQRFGSNLDPERWYAGLLNALGSDLGLEKELFSYWKDHQSFGPLQRLIGAVEHVVLPEIEREGKSLVVFVDEIDFVRSLPFSADEFFAGIRELYNRRSEDFRLERMVFCLLGVATPSELIQDVRITPFNVGRRIELTDFTLQECAPLALGLGENGDSLMTRVHYWTGGHPYLTQRLCQAVAESNAKTPKSVDRLVESLFFSAKAREEEPNLRDVSRRVLEGGTQDREQYLAGILDLFEQVRSRRKGVRDDETDPLVAVLKLAGLARVVQGYLWVRNRIYYRVFDSQWVRANMPDAEQRRLKSAARKAALRTAAVSGLVVLAMGALAWNSNRLAKENANLATDSSHQARLAMKESLLRLEAEEKALARADDLSVALRDKERARRSAAESAMKAEQGEASALQSAERERRASRAAAESFRLSETRRLEALAAKASADAAVVRERGERERAERLAFLTDMNLVQAYVRSHEYGSARNRLEVARGRQMAKDPVWHYWDARLNSYARSLETPRPISAACTSPDGKFVLIVSDVVEVFDSLLQNRQYRASGYLGAWSKDGRVLAIATKQKGIQLVDTTTWAARRTMKHDGVSLMQFSADNRRLLVKHRAGYLQEFDIDSGKNVLRPDILAPVEVATYSPTAKHIAIGLADGSLSIWSAESGQLVFTAKASGPITCIAFSPDEKNVVIGGTTGELIGWNLSEKREVFWLPDAHRSSVTSLSVSKSGKLIISGESNGHVIVTQLETGFSHSALEGNTAHIVMAEFALNDSEVVTASGQRVAFWKLRFGQTFNVTDDKSWVRFCRILPDTSRLLVANSDGQIFLSLLDGKATRAVTVSNDRPLSAVCLDNETFIIELEKKGLTSFDSKLVEKWVIAPSHLLKAWASEKEVVVAVYESSDRSKRSVVRVFDVERKKQLHIEVIDGEVGVVALNRAASHAAFGSRDGSVSVFDIALGKVITRLRAQEANGSNSSISCSSVVFVNERTLAAGYSDGTVRVWNVDNRQEVSIMRGQQLSVDRLAYEVGGRYLVSVAADGKVRFWDWSLGVEALAIDFGSAGLSVDSGRDKFEDIAISHDGRFLAVAEGGIAQLIPMNRETMRQFFGATIGDVD